MQTNKMWGPRTRFFELFLNQGYKLYVLPTLPSEGDQSRVNAFIYTTQGINPKLYYRHADNGKLEVDEVKIDDLGKFKQQILKTMEFYQNGNLIKLTERYLTEKDIKEYVSSSYVPSKKELDTKNDYAGLYVVAEAIQFSDSRVNPDQNPLSMMYKIDQESSNPCDTMVFDDITNIHFRVYDYQHIPFPKDAKCKLPLPDVWSKGFGFWSKSVKSLQPTRETVKIDNRFHVLDIKTDEDSFAISFLLNEFIKDPDGYNRNTFFYQTLNTSEPVGALTMYSGPLWDKNLGYDLNLPPDKFPGTGGYMPPASIYKGTSGWTFNVKHGFWKDVFKNPSVQGKICQYWSKAQINILNDQTIKEFLKKKSDWITHTDNGMKSAVERDCERYFPNTSGWCDTRLYDEKVKMLTDYVTGRLQWMNSQLGNSENECRKNIKKYVGN